MTHKPSTILIVDDDKTVIEQLQNHFRRRNYEPIATANPAIVDQTLAAYEVHLILLDLRMDRLSGYDVLKNLRSRSIHTPVLIITAYYQDERAKLREFQITEQDVIEKPFRDFAKIEAKINIKLNKVIAPSEVGSDYEDEIYLNNKACVIIVDDELEITEILAETLRERAYEVKTFGDGRAALDYLKSGNGKCHIGIIDMAIPGLLGHKLIEEMLRIDPRIEVIPVSAKYEEEMRERLADVGFDPSKLVTKPFDLPTLVEQVKVLAVKAGVLGGGGVR